MRPTRGLLGRRLAFAFKAHLPWEVQAGSISGLEFFTLA
jgi:hypothetical protein